MQPLGLHAPTDRRLRVIAVGAHADDIEIGAGGMLLLLDQLAAGLQVDYVIFTGTPARHLEAREAARSFLPESECSVHLHSLPEGRLPAVWREVKDILEGLVRSSQPDLILAPSSDDAHQDHRTIGEIVPSVFRDGLYLAYEIPKWDGDLARPTMYMPLPVDVARRKVDLLHKCFPSQHARDWWDEEVFLGLARLRGVECRSTYAEAFTCRKATILPE